MIIAFIGASFIAALSGFWYGSRLRARVEHRAYIDGWDDCCSVIEWGNNSSDNVRKMLDSLDDEQ